MRVAETKGLEEVEFNDHEELILRFEHFGEGIKLPKGTPLAMVVFELHKLANALEAHTRSGLESPRRERERNQ